MTRSRLRLSALEDRLAPSVSLVKDINRDLTSGYQFEPLVALNDTVLFRPTTSWGGPVLRSDGTPIGTGPVPGVQFNPYGESVEFAGALYFTGSDPASGDELWRTDGTAQGTRLILDTLI